MIILTNDPSITAWGYAVIETEVSHFKVVEADCLKTSPEQKKRRIRKGDDTTRRVSEINQHLLEIIRKYNVDYILSELPHGSQNASAAVMIGIVTGVAQTLADCLDIGIEWYSEMDSKKCLLNKRSATKDEMIKAVKSKYLVPWKGVKYKDEAIADAMAIYHVAKYQSSTLRFYHDK